MNLPPVRPLTPPPTLFDPPLSLPRWEMFPLQQQRAALRLLLQLLRNHRPLPQDVRTKGAPPRDGRASKEGADE